MDNGRPARSESAVARCHLWVHGDVQGVGFRVFAEHNARRWGLTGWARNLPDGRVEIVAEGAPVALEQFIADIRRGPSAARVEDVHVEWEAAADVHGFLIR